MAGLSSPALNPGSGGGGGSSSTITSLLGITTAGQKAMSGSLPVVIASDQTPVSVVISSGNITGFATAANQTNAAQKTQIVDGSGSVIASTANALNVSGQATGASVPANAFYMAGNYNGNLQGLFIDFGFDAKTFQALNVFSAPSLYNGSNWDRWRSVGTGVAQVSNTPTANVGWSFNYQSALSSTKAQLKASAGTFGGYINMYNPNVAVTYIQVFNKASASVTVGSTSPDFVITLPGVATASATGSDRNLEIANGVAMSTGITVAATTTPTGSSAPANAIVTTLLFV